MRKHSVHAASFDEADVPGPEDLAAAESVPGLAVEAVSMEERHRLTHLIAAVRELRGRARDLADTKVFSEL